ncbi:MAG: hypothetical protein ACK5MI_00030 [Mangrovibacterium sp.]
MQTDMRRVSIEGKGGVNKSWSEMLPYYEAEPQNYKNNLANLKLSNGLTTKEYPMLKPIDVTVPNSRSL